MKRLFAFALCGLLAACTYPTYLPPPVSVSDPEYAYQWNIKKAFIDVAWNFTMGDPNLVVAVIDSGVDPDHPDLKDNLLPIIDLWSELKGADKFYDGRRFHDYTGKDGNGHGTHVTGILAAGIDNHQGVAGGAGRVKILPIKATDFRGDTDAQVLSEGVRRAVREGAKILNISIGGPASDPTAGILRQAVEEALAAGVIIVAATGNESARDAGIIQPVAIPAAYPGVIGVAATTEYDKVANYSNGGPETSLAAPGGGSNEREGKKIRSTWPTYATFEDVKHGDNDLYADLAGTSMSCPHVTATVALLLSQNPTLTRDQIATAVKGTADDIFPPGFDNATGHGRLNAYKALASIGAAR